MLHPDSQFALTRYRWLVKSRCRMMPSCLRGNFVSTIISRGLLASIVAQVQKVDGFLTAREIEFLAVLGACPTSHGCIVELGTLFGKSATALALGARAGDGAAVHSVDLRLRSEVESNFRRSGVTEFVYTYSMPSAKFWEQFQEPVRLLWHDGANHRDYVASDIHSAMKLLSDGAIVAFHDVLNSSGERLHNFVDNVLASPHFGHAGVVGSIGWAQFVKKGCNESQQRQKQSLQRRLSWLKPFHTLPATRPRGLKRVVYETIRQTIPHGAIDAERWYRRVA